MIKQKEKNKQKLNVKKKQRENAYSRSVALSVFMNSCLARSRISGSYLMSKQIKPSDEHAKRR